MKPNRSTKHEARFTAQAKLAAIAFLAATLSHAAPPDPFPNLPGLVSAEEIAAATAAMRMMPGSEDLPVVASGRREEGHPMPSYVVFASPLVDFSGQVKTRRQAWCNYLRFTSAWQCTEVHDGFYATSRGIEHAYSYRMTQGQGNRQAAAEIADYMYSQCFNNQYEAIGGKPITPSTDANHVSMVEDDGKGFKVITGFRGDGDSFRLERTDRKDDGCGFRMVHARIKGVVIPESYARILEEQLKKATEERIQQEAALAEQNRLAQEAAVKALPKEPEIRSSSHGLKPDELMIFGLVLGVTAVYVLAPFLVVMVLVWLIWAIARIYKPGLSAEWPWAISGFALIAFVVFFLL